MHPAPALDLLRHERFAEALSHVQARPSDQVADPDVLLLEAMLLTHGGQLADAEITSDEEGVPRSQHGAGGLLDYPHYTRPAEFGGLKAPEVLLNGDHLQIRRWRREQQLRKTLNNRPDLLEKAALSDTDRRFLDSIQER